MAFVSPANSLGFMDGGLDLALTRMFPGIEGEVKRAIVERGRRTILGRPYLPIGEALVVPTCEPGVHVVSAPTMWLPQDVTGTHNPYHAMYAALREAAAHPEIDHVVAPGLCTGYGKMGEHDAVRLMMRAHRDVLRGRPPRWDAAAIEREQPKYYMNTEFAHMDFSQVRHV